MTVHRFFVDITTAESNGDEPLDHEKAGKLLMEYAKGTVTELLIPNTRVIDVAVEEEIHDSNPSYACDHCVEMARDGKH